MMLTDYKLPFVLYDGGYIIEAVVRFYEGAVSTKDELDMDERIKSVPRYQRSKRLKTKRYTSVDFGRIKTEVELCKFLNGELAKDTKRTVIAEQEVAKR